MQNLGARLREARRSLSWTQSELSHVARVSASDICKIERDRLKPSTYQINKLSAALNVSPKTLTGSDDASAT